MIYFSKDSVSSFCSPANCPFTLQASHHSSMASTHFLTRLLGFWCLHLTDSCQFQLTFITLFVAKSLAEVSWKSVGCGFGCHSRLSLGKYKQQMKA